MEMNMIGAEDSPYRGGIFNLKVFFPNNYPNRAPEVRFITPIYHVNVNHRGAPLGHISISILHDHWTPKTTMREVFCDIFVVINYLGNFESPYIMDMAEEMIKNRQLYEEKIRYFTKKYASIETCDKEYKSWDFTYNPQ